MGDEKEFDEFLCIETGDFPEPEEVEIEADAVNNIYQATYYRDLVTLFNEVYIDPEDTLVDFGCGLGRVLFYANSRHYCRIAGVEYDPEIYERLLSNAAGYQKRFYDQDERMSFYNISAEEYDIRDEDNYFYFFNPFSTEIFKRVKDNIVASVKRCPRDIYVMLYYPTFEYQKIMRDSGFFVLKKIIRLSGYQEDPDEKVLVYHMSRYFV